MASGDPNAAAPMGDPNTTADPVAGGDTMGGEDMPMSDQEESSDSTMDIINQLSPTDREAVRSYAESMLSRDENGGDEMGDEGEPVPAAPQDQNVMMEITKSRLAKVQKRLSEMDETLGDMLLVDKGEDGHKEKKVGSDRKRFRSPFDSPLD